MSTIDEVWTLVEEMNSDAYHEIHPLWLAADEAEEEGYATRAEVLREEASFEQGIIFRDSYKKLDEDTKASIVHWLEQDEVFLDQFRCYYNPEEFQIDFLWIESV